MKPQKRPSSSSSQTTSQPAPPIYTHPPQRHDFYQEGHLGHPCAVTITPPHNTLAVKSNEPVLPVTLIDGGAPVIQLAAHEKLKCPSAFVRAWNKMGGGSLFLSLAIHGGLMLLAAIIVFSVQPANEPIDFRPAGGTTQSARASDELGRKIKSRQRAAMSRRQPLGLVHVPIESDVYLPVAAPEIVNLNDSDGGLPGTTGSAMGSIHGDRPVFGPGGARDFAPPPSFMRARCSFAARLSKLRENGGTSECEAAVTKSLAWLKMKQNPDGSWGRANKCAMTGLVLLSYLGRCETPDSPFYGDNVMKGILYLIEVSKKNQWGFITEDFKGGGGSYEHGIATYALGEMYSLARLGSKSLPGMREAFEKGVELIIKTQNTDGAGKGSWDYYTKNVSEGKWTSGRQDLSVAGWQYQALKAAKNTSLKIDGLQAAIDNCARYLEGLQTKDGGTGTTQRDQAYNQWSLTGTGVLGLQTLGKGTRKSAITKGMKFLREFLTAEPLDWNKNCNLYCWYYYTQAFFQAGGDDWRFYNEQFLPQILANQNPDGSWKPGRPNWPLGDAADAIYRQALCTLQLEVYYRYLKVADRDDDSIFDK